MVEGLRMISTVKVPISLIIDQSRGAVCLYRRLTLHFILLAVFMSLTSSGF